MNKFKILMFLMALGLVSCQNDDSSNLLSDDSFASEAIVEETESVLDDIALYSESSFGLDESTGKSLDSKSDNTSKYGRSGYFKDCVDITYEETNTTRKLTLTFTGNCTDRDGNVITGTITKVRSKTDSSAERTITITNLSINGYVVNGSKSYTYTASNANGNPEMTGSIEISVETDAGTISKVGTRTVEITAGAETDTCTDDEKTITGSFEFTDATGAEFSMVIDPALVKPAGCKYIASGVKTYTRANGITTLDYGDGTCDNIAIKTAADGSITEIEIGKKRHH
jgi:hypothetical protein